MNNILDFSKLDVTTDNRVQVGPGQFIAKDSLSPLGYQMALNYSQTKDGPQSQPNPAATPETPAGPTPAGTPPPANTKGPSSSSSVILNSKANSAVAGAATADTPSPSQKRLMDYYGVGYDAVKGIDELSAAREVKALDTADQQKKDVETQKQQEQAALAQKTAAQYASEDANYSTLYNEYQRQRTQALTTMAAKAYAANPFATNSTAEGGYAQALNQKFDTLLTNLNSNYSAAKQNIAAGDTAAYTKILSDSMNLLRSTTSDLTGQLNTVTNENRQNQQFNLQMSKADQANFLNSLKEFSSSAAFNSDVQSYLDTGKATPGLQKVIDLGSGAGYNPDETVSLLAAGTKQAVTQQDASVRLAQAQASLALSQAKFYKDEDERAAIANTPSGGNYISAFNTASALGGQGDKKTSQTLQTLKDAVVAGDTTQAKNILTNYVFGSMPAADKTTIAGLSTISQYAGKLKAEIDALPANQKPDLTRGTIQEVAAKLGQNPNPELQKLGGELGHLQLMYTSNVFGKRAALSNNSKINNLFPSETDNPSLSFSKLDALLNSANDYLNGTVSSTIGSANFSAIYGNDGVLQKPQGGATIPTQGQTQTYQGSTYTYDGNQWVKNK